MTDEFKCAFCAELFTNPVVFIDHSRAHIRIGNPVGGSK